jgi:Uma2 family endonuclease
LPIYARARVPYLWLVDPIAQTLEVFEQRGEHHALVATHGGEERVRAVPFAAVELELAALSEAQGQR